jgi:hypothetical protein
MRRLPSSSGGSKEGGGDAAEREEDGALDAGPVPSSFDVRSAGSRPAGISSELEQQGRCHESRAPCRRRRRVSG